MTRSIIVTGSDSNYFPLLREMIASVRASAPGAARQLGILDCGLTADEIAWCRAEGAEVVQPTWDVTFPPGREVPSSFRAMTARPHLRRYFPGHDVYLWLDADVWVQDGRALDLFFASTTRGDIVVVPEVHRSYGNLRETRDDFEAANGRAYAEAFGAETAARLIRRPLNNAGVFALRANSPAWDLWARLMADAATRSANMIDQIALNVAIYDHGLKEVRLPAWCNWISHLATPAWSRERQCLVEPDPPFETIGILHLTLDTKWKPSFDLDVAETPPARITRSLRYAAGP